MINEECVWLPGSIQAKAVPKRAPVNHLKILVFIRAHRGMECGPVSNGSSAGHEDRPAACI